LQCVAANRLRYAALVALLPLAARAESEAGIEACTKLSDDSARLACFDREVATQRASEARQSAAKPAPAAAPAVPAPPALSAAPAAAAPPVPAAAPSPKLTEEQKMGLTPARIEQLEKPPGAPPPPKEITATIQSVALDGNGHQVFTLASGQIWRQVELDANFSVQPGARVVISRAMLGSYFMSFGQHRNTRVTRLH